MIRTCHNSFTWIPNLADPSGRLWRWRLRLSEYDSDVVHCAGIKHRTTEALSRLTDIRENQTLIEHSLPVAVLEATLDSGPNIRILTYTKTLSVEAGMRLTAQVIENNDAEMVGPAPQLQKFLQQQVIDIFCKQAIETVDQAKVKYIIEDSRLVVREAPIDGAA